MNKKVVIGILIAIVIIGAIIVLVGNYIYDTAQNAVVVASDEVEPEIEEVEEPEEVKDDIKIFSGDDRPIALMVDNNVNAQPQSGINSAYIVYEIIVEGNETRLMPVFKGVSDDLVVGPVRSVRHYYLDYMKENDAICSHLGQSPEAESDIKILKMDDINGQNYDTGKARTSTSLFWREQSRKAPHNAYTSIGSLKQIAETQGYSLTSTVDSVLNYVSKEVNLESDTVANSVTIPYASNHKVKYVYDSETGRYTRYSKGKLQTDSATGENITTKNIIITLVYNYTLDDGENKGRQTLNNVGTANGYYITNGKATPILCQKDSRTEQTKYTYYDGTEIEVNDGNTFINIVPINAEVVFE
jgi:hypothetical protein